MFVVITLQSPSHKVNGRNKLGVRTILPRSSTSQDLGVLYCANGCAFSKKMRNMTCAREDDCFKMAHKACKSYAGAAREILFACVRRAR